MEKEKRNERETERERGARALCNWLDGLPARYRKERGNRKVDPPEEFVHLPLPSFTMRRDEERSSSPGSGAVIHTGVLGSDAFVSREEASKGHVLDTSSLSRFMGEAKIPGFDARGGVVSAHKFSNGQSNPTYLVTQERQNRTPGTSPVSSWVLRKKPSGRLLPSAHAVEREHAFQSAIGEWVPVPRMHALCEDPRVLGAPFYLMEHCVGSIYKSPRLKWLPPARRRKIYQGFVESLARLHSIPADKLGDQIPRPRSPGNYGLRTLRRWKKQYLASCAAVREAPLENMMFLAAYLERHAPKEDSGSGADATTASCIIHGDFRMDNMIYKDGTDEVAAVLDWELATVGTSDQVLADVAYACLPYYLPPIVLAVQTLTKFCKESGDVVVDVKPGDGIPTVEEFLDMYTKELNRLAGKQIISNPGGGKGLAGSQKWNWFVCLALFRVAAILAGVGSRAKAGNASALDASIVGSTEVVSKIIDTAIGLIKVDQLNEGSNLRFQFLKNKARIFVNSYVLKNEATLLAHCESAAKWVPHPLIEKLKSWAKETGLWNCFLSHDLVQQARKKLEEGGLSLKDEWEWCKLLGPGLSNREYMDVAEIMGRCPFASEIFNCSAPDTGNMEVLIRFGTTKHTMEWLLPLLRGEIRSCFAMTEPAVASSDATNICAPIERKGNTVTVSGHKWWITGAMHPSCEICLFLGRERDSNGKGNRKHDSHTIVLIPMKTPGVKVVRPLDVMGFEDPPFGHAEMTFDNVTVSSEAIIHRPGKGFEIAQSRLGPGRLHHCSRALGIAERALEIAVRRALERRVFGSNIAKQGGFLHRLAEVRLDLDQARYV